MWTYALMRGPAYLRAKARAGRWVRDQQEAIKARRELVARLRTRSDDEVMRAMTRRYPLGQLAALAGERGAPRRPLRA
jgi:hypothetical protein